MLKLVAVCSACLIVLSGCAPKRSNTARALDSASSSNDVLVAKLKRQFDRYEAVQAELLHRVVDQSQLVTRDDLESLAALPDETWSVDELDTLKRAQDDDVLHAKQDHLQTSTLDLDKLRATPDHLTAFCTALPKGGMLHVHPWGTLDKPTAEKILAAANPPVDFKKLHDSLMSETSNLYPDEMSVLETLAQKYPAPTLWAALDIDTQAQLLNWFFLPPGSHGFSRFLGVFTVISALMFANNQFNPEPLMEEAFFERAKSLNVDYIEISRNIVAKPAWFQSLPGWAENVKTKYDITARYLAAFNRMKEPSFNAEKSKQLLGFPSSNVLIGINFVNDEGAFPAFEFGQTLYLPVLAAVKAGTSVLHRTIHAGELGDIRNVRDSMIMGTERIGHGVTFAADPLSVEYARFKHLPVEANLVSNTRLNVVKNMEEHPFLRLLRLGLPVSLSTDDEGIFESNIETECEYAVGKTDINYAELKEMSFNSIKTAFVDDTTKAELLSKLADKFAAFETQWESLH